MIWIKKTCTTAGIQTPDLPPHSLVSHLKTGAQIFQKRYTLLNIISARFVTRNEYRNEDLQTRYHLTLWT